MERQQRTRRAIESLEAYLAELPQQFLVEHGEGELLNVEGMYSPEMDLTLRSGGWNPVWRPTEDDGPFSRHWRVALRDLHELGLCDKAQAQRGWLPNELEIEKFITDLKRLVEERPGHSRDAATVEQDVSPEEPHPKDVAKRLPIRERRAYEYQRLLRAMAKSKDPKDQVLPDGTRVTRPLTMAHYEALWRTFQKSAQPTKFGNKPPR